MSSELEPRVEELRLYRPTARGAKKQLKELRLKHGEFLAHFARNALKTLPSAAAHGGAPAAELPLLTEACEAAQLMLWLGAFPPPVPEKLCHNVAARALSLGRHELATSMSAQVVRSLRVDKGKAAPPPKSTEPPPAAADGWTCDTLPAAGGGETGASCELALLAMCVHLPSLETLVATGKDGATLYTGADCSEMNCILVLCQMIKTRRSQTTYRSAQMQTS